MENITPALETVARAMGGEVVAFPGEKGEGKMVGFIHGESLQARLGVEEIEGDQLRATLLLRAGQSAWPSFLSTQTSLGFRMHHQRPQGMLESITGKIEGRRYEVDENRRDWFIAESNQAQDLLDQFILPVRRTLTSVLENPDVETITITFTPFLFRVRVTPSPRSGSKLKLFLDECLAFFDSLVEVDPARMAKYRRGSGTSFKKVPSWCGGCGEAMTNPKVLCASCFLPHHPDCWNYLGRCSQTGCPCREALHEE